MHNTLEGVPNLYQGDSIMPNGSFLAYQRYYPDMKVTDVFRIYPNTGITNDRIVQNYRGLGVYAYEEDIWYNQQRNALNDSMAFHLQTKFQPEFGNQLNQLEVSNMGPYAVISPGFPVLRQEGTNPALQQAVALLQYDDSQYEKITGQFDPQISGRIPDRANKDAVQALTTEVSRQQNDFATVPLDSIQDELYAILKRMTESYKKGDKGYETWKYFYDQVINSMFPQREYDMTKEDWKSTREKDQKDFFKALIEAIDYVGLDYITNDVLSLQALFEMAPTPEGKEYFRGRMAWARGASFTEIQSFFPSADDPQRNINDMPLALIENAMFWDTSEVAYNTLQNAVTHLQAHLLKGNEVVGSFKNGMDPVKIFNWLSSMIPNAQRHLDQLAQDPYQQMEFEQFKDLLDGQMQLADQFGKIAQKQAQQIAQAQGEQQQAQPQIDPETIAKIQTLEMQSQEKMRRQQEASNFKQQQMEQSQQFKQQLAQRQFDQKLQQQATAFALKQQEMMAKTQQ
jgi:hypothetical protein